MNLWITDSDSGSWSESSSQWMLPLIMRWSDDSRSRSVGQSVSTPGICGGALVLTETVRVCQKKAAVPCLGRAHNSSERWSQTSVCSRCLSAVINQVPENSFPLLEPNQLQDHIYWSVTEDFFAPIKSFYIKPEKASSYFRSVSHAIVFSSSVRSDSADPNTLLNVKTRIYSLLCETLHLILHFECEKTHSS